MAPVYFIYDLEFQDLVEHYEMGKEVNLNKTEDVVLADHSYEVWKDWNGGNEAYDMFELNDINDI